MQPIDFIELILTFFEAIFQNPTHSLNFNVSFFYFQNEQTFRHFYKDFQEKIH